MFEITPENFDEVKDKLISVDFNFGLVSISSDFVTIEIFFTDKLGNKINDESIFSTIKVGQTLKIENAGLGILNEIVEEKEDV